MADGNMLLNWVEKGHEPTPSRPPHGAAPTWRAEYTITLDAKSGSNTMRVIVANMDAAHSDSVEISVAARVLVVVGLLGMVVAFVGMGFALSDRTRDLAPVALVGLLLWLGTALALRGQADGDA